MWILLGTAPVLNSLLAKRVSFCSSFNALCTDTSFIKIGVCYQKLLTLEFNFHYRLSSHCVRGRGGANCLLLPFSSFWYRRARGCCIQGKPIRRRCASVLWQAGRHVYDLKQLDTVAMVSTWFRSPQGPSRNLTSLGFYKGPFGLLNHVETIATVSNYYLEHRPSRILPLSARYRSILWLLVLLYYNSSLVPNIPFTWVRG